MPKSNVKYYCADIETSGGFGGKFLLGGIFDGKKYQEFRSEDNFMSSLLEIEGSIFFHFLDFDIRFVLDWCYRKNIEIEKMPILSGDKKVVEIKIKKALFRDSFSLTQESLADLAESFGLKMEKTKLKDYAFTKPNKKLREYLKNDTIILHKILNKFYSFIGWQFFGKKTIASIALAKYKELSPREYNKIIDCGIQKHDYEFLLKGYFAAYYQIFNSQIENKTKEILKIDCNSYYAQSMRDNPFPWGYIKKVEKANEIQSTKQTKLGVIRATAKIPKGLNLGFLPIKTKQGVEYPIKGLIEGTWTTPEILFAENLGYQFEFKEAIFWQNHDYLFKKYVEYLTPIKEKSLGAKRAIAKRLLVSLYGKFAQKRDIIIFRKYEFPRVNRLYLNDKQNICQERKYTFTPHSHPEISIFTTSYARIFLYRFCQEIGWDRVFCIMSDSLVINASGLDNNFRRKWFHSDKIGRFKIVSKIEKGIIIARGVYALKDKEGTEIIRNQGGLREYNKLLTYKDFEKIIKSKKRTWVQYQEKDGFQRPKTVYAFLSGKSKLKEMKAEKRKISIGT